MFDTIFSFVDFIFWFIGMLAVGFVVNTVFKFFFSQQGKQFRASCALIDQAVNYLQLAKAGKLSLQSEDLADDLRKPLEHEVAELEEEATRFLNLSGWQREEGLKQYFEEQQERYRKHFEEHARTVKDAQDLDGFQYLRLVIDSNKRSILRQLDEARLNGEEVMQPTPEPRMPETVEVPEERFSKHRSTLERIKAENEARLNGEEVMLPTPEPRMPEAIEVPEERFSKHRSTLERIKAENEARLNGEEVMLPTPEPRMPEAIEVPEERFSKHRSTLERIKAENEARLNGEEVMLLTPEPRMPEAIEVPEERFSKHRSTLERIRAENEARLNGEEVMQPTPEPRMPEAIEVPEERFSKHRSTLERIRAENEARLKGEEVVDVASTESRDALFSDKSVDYSFQKLEPPARDALLILAAALRWPSLKGNEGFKSDRRTSGIVFGMVDALLQYRQIHQDDERALKTMIMTFDQLYQEKGSKILQAVMQKQESAETYAAIVEGGGKMASFLDAFDGCVEWCDPISGRVKLISE